MEELYKQYGEKMVQLEILQNQVQAIKNQIAEKLNTQDPSPPKVEPVKK